MSLIENNGTTDDEKNATSAELNEQVKEGADVSNPIKICAVCKDTATGMHFGAMSCEGCKGFFRRSIKKNAQFKCSLENKCEVSKENRKNCQACRFNACEAAGMKSSLVLSDEDVNKKRNLIKVNREKRLEQQRQKKDLQEQQRLKKLKEIGSTNKSDVRMTMEEKTLLDSLLKGHQESYDFAYQEYENFRGKEKISTPDITNESIQSSLAWLVASSSKSEDVQSQYKTMQDIPSTSKSSQPLTKQTEPTPKPSVQSQDHLDIFSSLHGTTDLAQSNSEDGDEVKEDNSLDKQNVTERGDASEIKEVAGTSADASAKGASDGDLSLNVPVPDEDNNSLTYLKDLLRSQGFSMSLVQDSNSQKLLQHFCDIMAWGIRKVIEFCKSISEFSALTLQDQIVLLRGGCLEMLVLRSYFAFSSDENKYMSDKFQYSPSDFLQAGASKEFVEKYNNLHLRMRRLNLVVEEICLLLALVLFSPDRVGLEDKAEVDRMQDIVARTLYAYEHTHKPPKKARTMYCELLLILPILRTINMLFSSSLVSLQETNEGDMNPLILEVNSSSINEE